MAEPQVAESVATTSEISNVESAEDWRSSLPEEIKGHSSLETIKDVGALAKSYLHAQALVGADKIALPGKHSTKDDWDRVYASLGRPDEPSGYNLEVGEAPGVDEEMVKWYTSAVHEAGLSERQAQALISGYVDQTNSRSQHHNDVLQGQRNAAETELKKEWGNAYDQRLGYAKTVLGNFGTDELADVQLADGSLLGDNPSIVRMLAKVGQFLSEKTGEDMALGEKTSGILAPEQLARKLREITDLESPYWAKKHPEHDWYVAEAQRLREMLTPTE